ncbi:MAG: VOC family protein [Woeseiaceae bacterium]
MPIEPYLFLNGRCEEAIDFYKKALGAKVGMLMRFSESPDPSPPGMLPPGFENKVMHSCLKIGDANLMLSDGMTKEPPTFAGFSLSLNARDGAEAERWFTALSEGGKVEMPLGKTFFAEHFGMVADKFGVGWMVIVPSDFEGPPAS